MHDYFTAPLRGNGGPRPRSAADRFWSHVNKNGPLPAKRPDLGPCWLWTAFVNPAGYAHLRINGHAQILVHRVSWEMHHGEVPGRLFVCHHCDVGCCVNPDHLFLGTQKQNLEDASRKGRLLTGDAHRAARPPGSLPSGDSHYSHLHPEIRQGEKNGFAKLTDKQVLSMREQRRAGAKLKDLARTFGVTKTTVCGIVTRRYWKHLP